MHIKVLKEALLFCCMKLLYSPFIMQLMGKKKAKITTTYNKKESIGLCVVFFLFCFVWFSLYKKIEQ